MFSFNNSILSKVRYLIPALFFALFMSHGLLAQSLRTVTFTGSINDFNATEERIAAADANNVVYAITFDASFLYVGAFRTSGTFGSSDNFSVFLDTDPQALGAGNGTAAIYNFNGVTGTTPFRTDYAFRVEQSYEEYRTATPGWSGNIAVPGGNVFTSSTCRELRIPLTLIGNPRAVYTTFWMGFSGGQFANAPGADVADGNNPTISNYFGGFGLTSAGCRPINVRNRVLTGAALVNAVPASGTTYGYVEVNTGTLNFANAFTVAAGGSLVHSNGTLTISNTVTLGNESTNFPNVSNGVTVNRTGGTFTGTSCNFVTNNATLNGTLPISNLTVNGGVNLTSSTTVNGTLQINASGFIVGNPTYGASSFLQYGTGSAYGVSDEWFFGDGTPGVGRPNNVVVQTGTTLNLPNTSRGMGGALTVQTGATLNLNAAVGANLFIKGNFVQSGTFNPNSRSVFFTGGAAQTISGTSPVTFAFLGIQKTAASTLQLSGADVVVTANSNDVLQFLGANVGTLDLNGRSLTFNNDGGTILCSGANHVVTNSNATASSIIFNGNKFIADDGSGSRSFTFGNVAAVRTLNIGIAQSKTLTVGNGSDVTLLVSSATNGITVNVQNIPGPGTTGTLELSSGANIQVNANGTFGLSAVNPARLNIGGLYLHNGGISNFNQGDVSVATNAGTFITSTGVLRRANLSAINSSTSTLNFQASSTYEHNTGASEVPFATWASTSNLVLQNTANTAMINANFGQTFGNFTYNSTQTMNLTNHSSGTITMNVAGNFTSQNTGQLTLHNNATGVLNVNVTGNLLVAGSSNAALLRQENNASGTCNLSVTGNLTLNRGTMTSTQPGTLSVGGNVLIEGSPAASQTTWTYGAATKTFAGDFIVNTTTGTFGFTSGTGAYSFTGATKTIGGNRDFTITNATVTGTYTNDNSSVTGLTIATLTVDGATASFTNGNTRTLVLTATPNPVVTLNGGSVDFDNTGNTVNYNVNSAQNVFVTDYHHLAVNQNTKTLNGNISVNGNITGAAAFALTGTSTITLSGDYLATGAVTPNSSTIIFNGSNQIVRTNAGTFNNVTLAGTGIKDFSPVSAAALTINGIFTINSGKILNLNNNASLTFSSTSSIAGTGTIRTTIAGVPTVAGTLNLGNSATNLNSIGDFYFEPNSTFSTITFSRQFNVGGIPYAATSAGGGGGTFANAAGYLLAKFQTSVSTNAISFANGNTGYIALGDNVEFAILGASGASAAVSGNVGSLRYFALGSGSILRFQPTATLAIGNFEFATGIDRNNPTFASDFQEVFANGRLNAVNSATPQSFGITIGTRVLIPNNTSGGSRNTSFINDLQVGDPLFVEILGVVTNVGTVVAVNSGFILEPGINTTIPGNARFVQTKLYRPIDIEVTGSAPANPTIEVTFRKHAGGVITTVNNIPNIAANRRSKFIFDVTTNNMGSANTNLAITGRVPGDYNFPVSQGDVAVFRWNTTASLWEKFGVSAIAAKGSNPQFKTNNFQLPNGTQSFVLGITGGVLPDNPTYFWTGDSNSDWFNPGNWKKSPNEIFIPNLPGAANHLVVLNANKPDAPFGPVTNLPVISSGTAVVGQLEHNALKLTVANGATLEVFRDYNFRKPGTTGVGQGLISRSGNTTIEGDGDANFTGLGSDDIITGTILYKTTGGLIGVVEQVIDDKNIVLTTFGGTDVEDLAEVPFSFFRPVYSGNAGTLNLTAGSSIITGSGFNPAWRGRTLLDNSDNFIGIISVAEPTRLVLHNAYATTTTISPFKIGSGTVETNTGATTDFQDGSTIRYAGLSDQNVAATSYYNFALEDTRAGLTTPNDLLKIVPGTGRTITVRRNATNLSTGGTFTARYYNKPTPVTGPRFIMQANTRFLLLAQSWAAGSGQPLRNFAPGGSLNSNPVQWGVGATDYVDFEIQITPNSNLPLGETERTIAPKIRNLTIFGAAGNSQTTFANNGNAITYPIIVHGATNFTGFPGNRLQYGSSATPMPATFLGSIDDVSRMNRGGGCLVDLTIGGTGTIGGSFQSGWYSGSGIVPSLNSFTLSRTGSFTLTLDNISNTNHWVTAGNITVTAGRLYRPLGGDINCRGTLFTIAGTGIVEHGGAGGISASGSNPPLAYNSNLLISGNGELIHTGIGQTGSIGSTTMSGNSKWTLTANTSLGSHGTLGDLTVNGGTLALPAGSDLICLGNFTQSGGTISKPSGKMIVQGNIAINGGTRSLTGTTLEFGPITVPGPINVPAAAPQTFSSTNNALFDIGTLLVNKPAGNFTAASGRLRVRSSIDILSNTSITATGNIILGASISGSARVSQLPNVTATTQLLGTNWTVEKYINSSTAAGWHFVGTSIQGQTISDWGDDFRINTPLVAPSTTTVAPNRTNFFTFDGTASPANGVNANEKNGWRIPTTMAINAGKGYRAYFDNAIFSNSRIVDNTGAITHGSFNFGVTHNPLGYVGGSGPGWNLLANPYPSAVDWDVANGSGWTRTNVLGTYWTWNKTIGSGAYATYAIGTPGGIGTNGATRFIPANQGFLVVAQSGGNMASDERIKSNSNPAFLRTATEEYTNAFLIGLSNSANTERDEIIMYERQEASDNYDSQWDAPKLNNPGINFSTETPDGRNLAINAFGSIGTFKIIKANVSVLNPGNYKFDFRFIGGLGAGVSMYIRDNYMGTIEPIAVEETIYNFTVSGDPNSHGNSRFEILFGNNTVTFTLEKDAKASFNLYPNPSDGQELNIAGQHIATGTVKVSMYDLVGKEVFSETLNANGRRVNATIRPDLKAGVYTVVFNGANTFFSTKHIVK